MICVKHGWALVDWLLCWVPTDDERRTGDKKVCNNGAHDIISGSFGSQPNFLETLCVVDQEARSGSYTLLDLIIIFKF